MAPTASDHPSILVVEDDFELASLITDCLRKEGFATDHAADGKTACTHIVDKRPDLVVLDIMLPELDGFSVCKKVRPDYTGPILILTARDDDLDQILGFELGADDFVIKPVRPRVLLARIRALLRRAAGPPDDSVAGEVTAGELTVNATRREVLLHSEPVHLTTIEFDLLWYLVNHAGQVVTRNAIHQALYNSAYDGLDRSIDVYISRIRQKLGDDPGNPRFLKTVRGAGYLFTGVAP